MNTQKVATTLATKSAIVIGVNILGSWGSRIINWYPQSTLPGIINACIYTTAETIAFTTQQALSDQNPSYHLLPIGYQPQKAC